MRNFTTIAVLGSLLFSNFAFAAVEISDGSVVALYHLEDEADASGNGYNLTAVGVSFAAAKLSNGANFDATTDTLINGNVLGGSQVFSYCAWFNTSAVGSHQILTLTQAAESNNNLFLTGTGLIRFEDSLTIYVGAYSINTDTHVCITKNGAGGALQFYKDGSLASSTTAGNKTPSSLSIGNDFPPAWNTNFSGWIDEVVITNNILSSTTISALYNGGAGAEVCVSAGCGAGAPATSTASSTIELGTKRCVTSYQYSGTYLATTTENCYDSGSLSATYLISLVFFVLGFGVVAYFMFKFL